MNKFIIEYIFSNTNDDIEIKITHKKTKREFSLLLKNPNILDINKIVNDYLKQIECDIREDLINKLL